MFADSSYATSLLSSAWEGMTDHPLAVASTIGTLALGGYLTHKYLSRPSSEIVDDEKDNDAASGEEKAKQRRDEADEKLSKFWLESIETVCGYERVYNTIAASNATDARSQHNSNYREALAFLRKHARAPTDDYSQAALAPLIEFKERCPAFTRYLDNVRALFDPTIRTAINSTAQDKSLMERTKTEMDKLRSQRTSGAPA